jgi:hypothetical protein
MAPLQVEFSGDFAIAEEIETKAFSFLLIGLLPGGGTVTFKSAILRNPAKISSLDWVVFP